MNEETPTLAPDRVTVAFHSNVTGAFHIYTLKRNAVLPLGGYQATCLTCNHPLGIVQAAAPAWAPGLP